MKLTTLARTALPALAAAALLSAGCARKPAPLEPRIPEGSVVALLTREGKFRDNPVLREFRDATVKLNAELHDLQAGAPDEMRFSPELERLLKMNETQAFEYFFGEGVRAEWDLITLGATTIPEDIEEEGLDFPPLAVVSCFDRPVDLAAAKEKICALIKGQMEFMAASEDDNASAEEMLENFREAMDEALAKIKEIRYQGRPAWQLEIGNEEIASHLKGFQPVLATVGDGRLAVGASSLAHLDEIAGLYAGTVRPMAADAPLAKEMALPEDVFGRMAITDIQGVLKKFMPKSLYDEFQEEMAEDDDVGPYLTGARTLRFESFLDSAAHALGYRIELELDAGEKVASLGNLVQEGKGFLTMMASMAAMQNPENAFLAEYPNRLEFAAKGTTASVSFRVTPDDIRQFSKIKDLLETLSPSADDDEDFDDEEDEEDDEADEDDED